MEIEGVERRAIVRVERQPEFDALRQVWIRNEMTPERNQVRVSLFNNRLGAIGFKSTRCDDFPFENLAQLRCRNRRLALCDEHVAFDPRFNDVKIRESEAVQLFCNIIEECGRIAVRHKVPCSTGPNSHGDPIFTPHRYHCFHYFQQETGAVLDRPAIRVGALVAAILQKLIRQIAVGGVKFGPVKARSLGSLGGFAIVLDDARNFFDVERPMWRGLDPAAGRGNAWLGIKPIGRNDGRRHRRCAIGHSDVRRTSRVPEL